MLGFSGWTPKVNGFRSYVDLYVKDKLDETGVALKVVNETVNERWEVCLTLSEKGFQQISFVNSIATTKVGPVDPSTEGGTHSHQCSPERVCFREADISIMWWTRLWPN